MDLTWSEREEAFRAEARKWLAANVPHHLASGNTRAGFAAHTLWVTPYRAAERFPAGPRRQLPPR